VRRIHSDNMFYRIEKSYTGKWMAKVSITTNDFQLISIKSFWLYSNAKKFVESCQRYGIEL